MLVRAALTVEHAWQRECDGPVELSRFFWHRTWRGVCGEWCTFVGGFHDKS